MLNREGFARAATPKTKIVEIPEWGDSVCIRQLSARHFIDGRKAAPTTGNENGNKEDDSIQNIVESIINSVVDESSGAPIFSDADRDELMTYSFAGLIHLARAINEFNGLKSDVAKN